MYGFSGYGTNEYASRRFFGTTISGPIVKIAMTVWKNTYGIVQGWQNTYRVTNILKLLFKSTTLEL